MTGRTETRALVVSACLLSFAIGCQPATLDGTPYARSGRRATDDGDDDDGKKTKTKTSPTGEDDEATGTTRSAQTQSSPLPDAGTTTPTPAPTPTPTPTPTPAPTPSCQSPSGEVCFDCCLGANPGAASLENAFDACLSRCFDDSCAAACEAQHEAQCGASAACRSHHACLEANGCFGLGF